MPPDIIGPMNLMVACHNYQIGGRLNINGRDDSQSYYFKERPVPAEIYKLRII